MSNIFMFRGVDYELGFADFQISKRKTGLSHFLNLKDRKVSNKEFTYRVINHWEKNKLIESNRENNRGWRRYSVMDLVWLYIIKELRNFGVSHDLIQNVKKSLSENRQPDCEFFQLEYYISLVLVNKPVYLLIFNNGDAHPLTEKEYQLNREYSSNMNHIQLNLNSILQQILPEKDLKPHYGEDYEHTLEERKAIQMLRLGNYNEINLTLEEGSANKLEEHTINIKQRNIEDIINHINNKKYKSIDIKQGIENIISLRK